jgi:hypothetical protein
MPAPVTVVAAAAIVTTAAIAIMAAAAAAKGPCIEKNPETLRKRMRGVRVFFLVL